MEERRIRKTEALKSLIDGVNIYTGEVVLGLDESLKKDLCYILEYLERAKRTKEGAKDSTPTSVASAPATLAIRKGKIIVDDQVYYLHDGKISDKSGMTMPSAQTLPVLFKHYSSVYQQDLDEASLLECIKGVKEARLFDLCLEILEKELSLAHSHQFLRTILPIYTSSLRELKKPQEVVDFWERDSQKFSSHSSPVLYTSVASAYCDIGDYIKAKRIADRAYASNGGGTGHKTELSLVYMRIKKATGGR